MHCTACAGLLGSANRCFKQNAVRASPGSGAERFPVFMAVLTAHAPVQWMLDAADYVTEMKCRRHPYQKGIAARQGIEY